MSLSKEWSATPSLGGDARHAVAKNLVARGSLKIANKRHNAQSVIEMCHHCRKSSTSTGTSQGAKLEASTASFWGASRAV
jgi:hypothetical protein